MNELHPLRSDIKPGHWVVLRNQWLVGPVLPPNEDDIGVYVLFSRTTSTRYQVFTREDDSRYWDDARRVVFSGPRKEALAYWNQILLADEIMDEIIDEELQARKAEQEALA